MIWIDFALLWYASYRTCRNRCKWSLRGESLALALLLALVLKSLILFFLILIGVQPTSGIQVGVSVLLLAFALFLPEIHMDETSSSDYIGLIWVTFSGVGGLFIFSMFNAWFFPITESDAIWYHIKGMSFFHEIRFDSEWVVPQLKQYPPFIPLLFAYLIAFDSGFLKAFFPIVYLCLTIIFYSRVLLLTGNKKMACLFTLILATTPYFWWHGVLPFLDMTTAVFYSTGIMYVYFLVSCKIGGSSVDEEGSYALVSGFLLGVAAWTRIEFLLYDLVPVFLTIYVFSRYPDKSSNLGPLKLFFLFLLLFPSIWFLNLMAFDMALWSQIKMVGGVCVVLWVLALGFAWGKWKIHETGVRLVFILVFAGFIALLFALGGEAVPVWEKITISLFRTSTVHIYYLFTASLVIFIFFEKLQDLSEQKKILGYFLILFLSTHFAIFAYATPKWSSLGEFVYATFIQPGNSVNLSDTRGMMSVYPVFIFFIASLPFVRRRLINE